MANPSLDDMPGPRLIVVDDDPAVRHALSFSLDIEGYAVSAYTQGEAARLPDDAFDAAACLIVDHAPPGGDGLAFIAGLRLRGVTAPAILTSTRIDARVTERAAAASISIVEKPLFGDSLLRAIELAMLRGAP